MVTTPDGRDGGPLGQLQAGTLLMKELLGVGRLMIFMVACGANHAMMMACIPFG